MVTKGRPISTPSAPRARALNTSMPERMPPSTSTVILPPTASTMAGSTSAVAGHWSSTRPPWLETTMPLAPASRAFLAPATVMMPLRMKGLPAIRAISCSSSTVLLPAGGVRFFRKGRPAASMSMAMAKGSAAFTSSIFSRMVSMFQGLTVGTPQPPDFFSASAAPSITAGLVPSPVKAAMPFSAQADTRMSLY